MKTIEELLLKRLWEEFDEFVRACMDDSGKPTAPSSKALAKARGYLPPYCASAYKKPAQTVAPVKTTDS